MKREAYIKELEKNVAEGSRTVLVIDGNCGSGKTHFAGMLAEHFGASVIHMDDFFVPDGLRDEAHFVLPVHFERFREEVIGGLNSGRDFEYRIFDCFSGNMDRRAAVRNSGLVIVEGSYSTADIFGKYYDRAVFVTCSYETRLERLRNRTDSRDLMDCFINEWIPKEDAFFLREKTREKAERIIEGE